MGWTWTLSKARRMRSFFLHLCLADFGSLLWHSQAETHNVQVKRLKVEIAKKLKKAKEAAA